MDACLNCELSARHCERCGQPICDAHTDSQYDACLYCVSNYIYFDHDGELEQHYSTDHSYD